MKPSIFLVIMLEMTALFLVGCRQPPDTDVTSDPQYNFSSFAGTVWKTKVKVAVIDVKRYTNEHALDLFPPEAFDPTHPKYDSVANSQIIAVLPVGARVRIERLMKDHGNWGGVRVAGTLDDEAFSQKIVYVSPRLLAKNLFIWPGWSSSTNWGIDPDMLAPADRLPPQPAVSAADSAPSTVDIRKSGYDQGYSNGVERGTVVARNTNTAIDLSPLSDPWLGNREWRVLAVKIHGEDYVAAYELGYRKGYLEGVKP